MNRWLSILLMVILPGGLVLVPLANWLLERRRDRGDAALLRRRYSR